MLTLPSFNLPHLFSPGSLSALGSGWVDGTGSEGMGIGNSGCFENKNADKGPGMIPI